MPVVIALRITASIRRSEPISVQIRVSDLRDEIRIVRAAGLEHDVTALDVRTDVSLADAFQQSGEILSYALAPDEVV